MTKITGFDRAQCAEMSERINTALRPLADELGVAIVLRGGTFTHTNFTCKVEIAIKATDGVVLSREATTFQRFAHSIGLDPGLLGKTFRHNGKEYTLLGMSAHRGRLPVIASDSSGQRYKLSVSAVLAGVK